MSCSTAFVLRRYYSLIVISPPKCVEDEVVEEGEMNLGQNVLSAHGQMASSVIFISSLWLSSTYETASRGRCHGDKKV